MESRSGDDEIQGRAVEDEQASLPTESGEREELKQQRSSLQFRAEEESEVQRSGGEKERKKDRKRDVNGLRAKRGGKGLKIHVVSPEEEAERKRAQYIAALAAAGNETSYPLYPLDLHEHSVDSRDNESERSSSLSSMSPEVAANGFGSPIEIPVLDSFDGFDRRRDETGYVAERMMTPLDEIPLTAKYSPARMEQEGGSFEEEGGGGGGGGGGGVVRRSGTIGRSFTAYALKTAFLIFLWYLFSTLLILYNKEIVGKDHEAFPFPLLMNTIHFGMQGIISNIMVRCCCESMRRSRIMTWKEFSLRVVPLALATALDIDLTNKSLAYLSITFETMCKSGAPVFILLFAFFFKLEVPSWRLFGIILVISTGVMLAVSKATDFDVGGFLLIMASNVMAGFRWTVTQLLLQKQEYGLNNPFVFMSVLTPIMAAVSLLLSLILEPWSTLGESVFFNSAQHAITTFAFLLAGGALAFFMVSAEFVLLSETSALTLTVAGLMKEMLTVYVSVLVFKDEFTVLKGIGLVVVIIGGVLYNIYKLKKLDGGEHGFNTLNGTHQYETLEQNRAVYELGEEDDML